MSLTPSLTVTRLLRAGPARASSRQPWQCPLASETGGVSTPRLPLPGHAAGNYLLPDATHTSGRQPVSVGKENVDLLAASPKPAVLQVQGPDQRHRRHLGTYYECKLLALPQTY